jgi:hypothetical protein
VENHVCLSRGVQVAGAAWHVATRIMAGVGDLVQMTSDGRTGQVLGGEAIEMLSGAMCGLHRARGDEEHEFLGCASKPRSTVCVWFDIKITRTVFSCLTSKPVARIFRFGPQNRQLWFGELGLKITTMVSWFVQQNQACFGLSVAPQNRRREDDTGHALRSGGSLRLEKSHARISQSGVKTVADATAGGARTTITEVTSGSS